MFPSTCCWPQLEHATPAPGHVPGCCCRRGLRCFFCWVGHGLLHLAHGYMSGRLTFSTSLAPPPRYNLPVESNAQKMWSTAGIMTDCGRWNKRNLSVTGFVGMPRRPRKTNCQAAHLEVHLPGASQRHAWLYWRRIGGGMPRGNGGGMPGAGGGAPITINMDAIMNVSASPLPIFIVTYL